MTSRRRVLVTGAAGYIAGQLLPAFRDRYDLTLVDVTTTHSRTGVEVPGVEVLNLLDDPHDRFAELCEGVDVVVHCGMRPPASRATPPSGSTST